MTEVRLRNHACGFKENNKKLEEQGELKRSTVRQRRYAVDELVEYFTENDLVIDTEDYFGSTDNLKQFFKDGKLTSSKVACVRAFLSYVEKQLPTRDAEHLYDIKEKIKHSRLSDDTGKGKTKAEKVEEKILTDEELAAVYFKADLFEETVIRAMLDMGTRPGELAALAPNDINRDYSKGGIAATVKIDKSFTRLAIVQLPDGPWYQRYGLGTHRARHRRMPSPARSAPRHRPSEPTAHQ